MAGRPFFLLFFLFFFKLLQAINRDKNFICAFFHILVTLEKRQYVKYSDQIAFFAVQGLDGI